MLTTVDPRIAAVTPEAGWLCCLIPLAIIIVSCMLIASFLRERRRQFLFRKYGDATIVDKIMRRMHWQGQTTEQLVDSLGRPLDVSERVFKTKTTETWKYYRVGKNRFLLRVTVENGVVVGWDRK